jgi:hypothetical protein
MNPLQIRLAALRRWLRLVITVRGVCQLVTLVLVLTTLAGWVDWRVHLPDLVRAAVLAGTLGSAGFVAFRHLLGPLQAPADDLSLALRIEAIHPFLKDELASTIQFLAQPENGGGTGSARLRCEAVERGLRKAEYLDFRRVIDTRGLPVTGLFLVGMGALTLLIVLLYPAHARTALERLTNPFGGRDWPRQTRLEIQAPSRIARGEVFEIRGLVYGIAPSQAVIEYEGDGNWQQSCSVFAGKNGAPATLTARRERVERSFRFQVKANDAVTDWQEVTVSAPPVLVPLEGRPSPQVRLHFPAYTDMTPLDLPDGSGDIEAVAGTRITLRAATDRPIARAWIEYRPDQLWVRPACWLGAVGTIHPAAALVATAAGQAIGGRVPIQVDATGCGLSVSFSPGCSGMYALRFEDETGLGNARVFDLRVFRDPEPTVHLERPSSQHDSLEVLPNALINLRVHAEDPQFALRSVYLEYRYCKTDPPQRMALYDHEAVGRALGVFLGSMSGRVGPLLPLRLRPASLQITRQLSLNQIKHLDQSDLREGDVITLQVCADDFDDVAVDKQPGRSHEVDIRIVGRSMLEAGLNTAQQQLQQELMRLRKRQQDAVRQLISPAQQWDKTGRLRDQDIDQLLQAEQLQQQIRARMGTPQEGLLAEAARILQTMRDNHLPRTGAQDRLETVQAELGRLARDELPQIESALTRARKDKNASSNSRPLLGKSRGPLSEARQHQDEVDQTLGELLKLMETWGSFNEVKGEARAVFQEQRRLHEETRRLDNDGTRGKRVDDLSQEQRAALDKVAESQNKLRERSGELVERMDRMARQPQDKENPMAEAFRAAARQGQQDNLGGQMQRAGQMIRDNQLQGAAEAQQKAMQTLEDMVQSLEKNQRERELERLRKKLQEAEDKLADLIERQDQLRKKTREAEQTADLAQRQEQLKMLFRQQEQLRQETQQLVRELSRLRSARAGQAVGDASDMMERAGQQMSRDEQSEDAEEEALNRLNEARRELRQERQEIEEELAREKLAKTSDQIKRLRERQDAAIAESTRIEREVLQAKKWDRNHLISLGRVAENQQELGAETEAVAKDKLAGARVFARMLTKSADAMRRAADRIRTYREQTIEKPEEAVFDAECGRLQREALHRLDQLLEALKPKKESARRAPERDAAPAGGNQSKGSDDRIGFLAQVRGLRLLQQDVNDRTAAFAKQHPDTSQLSTEERHGLELLRQEQAEIAEILEELARPAIPEGALPKKGVTAVLLVLPATGRGQPPPDAPEPPVRLKKKERPKPPEEAEEKTEPVRPRQPQPGGDPQEITNLEEDTAAILARVSKNMGAVDERLGKIDPGEGTQQVQRDIVKDLDALLEKAKQPQQQQQNASRSPTARDPRDQSSGNQQTNQPSGTRSQAKAERKHQTAGQIGGGGKDKPEGASRIADLYKDVWGHLPETLRQEIDQYAKERFMAKYDDLLKQYYSTIATKGHRKGD